VVKGDKLPSLSIIYRLIETFEHRQQGIKDETCSEQASRSCHKNDNYKELAAY